MREFAVTPATVISMLLAGMRIRINRTQSSLARLLDVHPERIQRWETDEQFARHMPVGEFIDVMHGVGARVIIEAPSLSGTGTGFRELADDEPEVPFYGEIPTVELLPDPEPQPDLEWQPDETPDRPAPRTVYLSSPAALSHALGMAALRSGKLHSQIADEMGVNQTTVSRHIREGGNVTLDLLARYGEYFNINFVVGTRRAETE